MNLISCRSCKSKYRSLIQYWGEKLSTSGLKTINAMLLSFRYLKYTLEYMPYDSVEELEFFVYKNEDTVLFVTTLFGRVRNLTNLELNISQQETDVQDIAESLKKIPDLEHLKLEFPDLDTTMILLFIEVLGKISSLKSLDISGNRFSAKEIETIAESVGKSGNSSLRS